LHSSPIQTVIITLPVLLLGGTEIQTLSLVKVLLSNSYKVTVCCYYEFDLNMVRQFEATGADVLLMKYERATGLWHLAKGLIPLFKERKPDIVHVQYLAPGLIPILAARLACVPVILATVHIAGSIVYGKKAKMLLRIAALFCTRFICVSRGVEEFWFGSSQIFDPANVNKRRKHYTVYNAIDTTAIAQAVIASDKTKIKRDMNIQGRPVIGIVGRLAEQKGHSILLDAMTQIVKEIPDVMLIVIGDGPEKQKLIEKTTSLQLDKNIFWLGAWQQNKVFELYAIMDIFVMPSLYEGFGLTAAEAMAACIPVVGTKVEGLSEVIDDGVSGVLVPAGDSDALSETILKFLKNPEKAKTYGKNGRMRADRLFSLENFSKSMQGIYQSI